MLFIIDPFYSLPLLAVVAWVLWRNPPAATRRRLAVGGLAVSSAYLMLALLFKSFALAHIGAALDERGGVQQRITYSTPFNIVLWQTIAMTDDGYWAADYSLLGCGITNARETPAHPHRKAFVAAASTHVDLGRLVQFSKGFFRLRDEDDSVIFNDLRFGNNTLHPFQYRVGVVRDGRFVPVEVVRPYEADDESGRLNRREFAKLWRRIFAECAPATAQ